MLLRFYQIVQSVVVLHIFDPRWIFHMLLKLVAEVADSTCHRPCCSITQWTNGFTLNLALDIPKQIHIGKGAFPFKNLVEDSFHPAGSFTARAALSAALVVIET